MCTANAQIIPPVTEPGNIDRTLQQKQPFIDDTEVIIPDIKRSSVTPNGAEQIRFKLNEIIVEGSTLFSNDAMAQHYKDKINQYVPLTYIYDIANKITEMYLNEGYTLSFAIVPQQKISNGAVKIQVIEGRISNVVIDGRYAGNKRILNKWKKAITQQTPAKSDVLINTLLVLKRLPGTNAIALLEKSDTPNASVVRLVMDHKYFEGSVEANNLGSRYVGPFLNQNTFNFNSLFGLSERISYSNSVSLDESEFYSNSIGFEIPINHLGTTISSSISNSVIEPGFKLELSSVDSESVSTEIAIKHPLILTRDEKLDIGLSFNTYNSQTDILDQVNSQDRIRYLRISGDYFKKGVNNSYSFASLSYSRGLEVLNSSDPTDPLLSRSGGRSDFNKFNIYLGHSRYLHPNINLLVQATGQWSETQLLSSEEFGFGGRLFGRGYNYSEFNGDSGIANSIELKYIGKTKFSSAPEYHIYSFYDWAMLWDIDSAGTDDRKSAASAGFGLRIPEIKDFSILFEVAKPLTRPAASRGEKDDDDFQMLFSVKKKFEYKKK
jgi:hemolysin activation/secretion protein